MCLGKLLVGTSSMKLMEDSLDTGGKLPVYRPVAIIISNR